METLTLKSKVFESAKAKQMELIEDFRARIAELEKSEDSINEDQHGSQEIHDAGSLELINSLGNELKFAAEELYLLKQLDADKVCDTIQLGAIVKTDKMTFFPSVSLEVFEVDGDEYFGISEHAPLYKEMQGKKAGESFSFKDNIYQVLEVH